MEHKSKGIILFSYDLNISSTFNISFLDKPLKQIGFTCSIPQMTIHWMAPPFPITKLNYSFRQTPDLCSKSRKIPVKSTPKITKKSCRMKRGIPQTGHKIRATNLVLICQLFEISRSRSEHEFQECYFIVVVDYRNKILKAYSLFHIS